jgi:uncharacterized protein YndB with AHSA1/START domain
VTQTTAEKSTTAAHQQSVIHSTFSIERSYPQSPTRVFFAHADQAMKRRWLAEGEGWTVNKFTLDFRVGGSEISRFRYLDGPEITYDAVIQDVVPDQRIVFAYRMAVGPNPISVSLATVELVPSGSGTRLIYTEQGAYFDDEDAPKNREHGSRELLEKLAEELQNSK